MFAVENLKGFFAKAMKGIPNGDIGVAVSGGGDSIALLYLTVDWALKNDLGNIDEKSLVEIWNGKILRDLRIRHLNGERDKFLPCKDCSMNEFSEFDNIDDKREAILQKIT